MSTGLECGFVETPSGKHYYSLEIGGDPDDEDSYHTDEYVTYGPFPDFETAKRHLEDNHPNPGGYSIDRLDAEPTGEMARTLSEAIAPETRSRYGW
jgi:hypothetical protein